MFQKIYEQGLCSLNYHQKSNFIQMLWQGDLNNDQYKAFWHQYMEKQLDYPNANLLVDQRNVGKVDMAVRAWFVMSFLPKYRSKVRADLHIAVMQPRNVINKSAIQYLVSAANNLTKYKIQIFSEDQEAFQWLDLIHKQDVYAKMK